MNKFVLVLFCGASQLFAQQPNILVYGTVSEFSTRGSIPFPIVSLNETASDTKSAITKSDEYGRYELVLSEEKGYLITFSAPGKLNKSVLIETRGPSADQWKGGFGMNIDVSLLDSIAAVDPSILLEPIGIARWNKRASQFQWDMQYSRKMKPKHEALMKAYQAAKGLTPAH